MQASAVIAAVCITAGSAWFAKRSATPPPLTVTTTQHVATEPAPAETQSVQVIDAAYTQQMPERAAVDAPENTAVGAENIRYFNGRPVRPARTVWMTVTAYSPDERSCGIYADGITASGKSVWTNAMQLVAADKNWFNFGELLSVPGYAGDEIVPVLDRGGAIKGDRLDVLYPTHNRALQWGVQRLPVTVWEYADEG